MSYGNPVQFDQREATITITTGDTTTKLEGVTITSIDWSRDLHTEKIEGELMFTADDATVEETPKLKSTAMFGPTSTGSHPEGREMKGTLFASGADDRDDDPEPEPEPDPQFQIHGLK